MDFVPDKNATVIHIPEWVQVIPSCAFKDYTKLQKVILPDRLQEIEYRAFSDCKNLKEIFLPATLKTFGHDVFSHCSSLERITVSPENKNFHDDDGVLYDDRFQGERKLLWYPPARKANEYHIPEGVTQIERQAFREAQNLVSVVIPESVEKIKEGAFINCRNLRWIKIPDTVQIGDDAFFCTRWLMENPEKFVIAGDGILLRYNGTDENVIIPDGVKEIKGTVFFYHQEIKSVTIPHSMRFINRNIFNNCVNLKTIHLKLEDGRIFSWDVSGFSCRDRFVECLEMIMRHDFTLSYERIPKIWILCMIDYAIDMCDSEVLKQIHRKFIIFAEVCIELRDMPHFEKLVNETNGITCKNIDELINYAIDCAQKGGSLEMQIYLINYKKEHFGFADPKDLFKL